MIRPVSDGSTIYSSALGPVVFAMAGPHVDFANDPVSWRFGHPAGSGSGSARGLARLLAATVTGVDGTTPVLSADTVEIIGQQQVRGYDEVLGQPGRSHSIVFQKPTAAMAFGGPRAFGHDGAAGAFASVDPDTGIAFAYTIARGPWPGGADPRAIALAAELGELLSPDARSREHPHDHSVQPRPERLPPRSQRRAGGRRIVPPPPRPSNTCPESRSTARATSRTGSSSGTSVRAPRRSESPRSRPRAASGRRRSGTATASSTW